LTGGKGGSAHAIAVTEVALHEVTVVPSNTKAQFPYYISLQILSGLPVDNFLVKSKLGSVS